MMLMARHPYTIRPARADEQEAAFAVERAAWAPYNWLAEGGVGLDYDPELHFVAVAADGRMVATIDGCGVEWDGNPETLPAEGWRYVNLLAADAFSKQPDPACALGASILPDCQGGGLSADLLVALRDRALELGYKGLLAP